MALALKKRDFLLIRHMPCHPGVSLAGATGIDQSRTI